MYSHIEEATTRRVIALVAAVTVLVVGLWAVPASAEAPITFTESVTFTDINPCTGAYQEIALNGDFRVHEHENNVVVHVTRTGTTDSGYVMDHGVDTFVENKNVVRGSVTDQWRHPDGSKFRVKGHFTFNINQMKLVVDQLDLSCIGN